MVETSAFGDKLRRTREERGFELDAVASATRIARRHLDALERNDLESLPSGPFGRSYLRAYAEFLGIDPEPILDSYRTEEAERGLGPDASRERAVRELSRLLDRKPTPKRFRPSLALGFLILISGLLGLWWAGRSAVPVSTDPVLEEPLAKPALPMPEAPIPMASPVEEAQVEEMVKEPSSPTAIRVSEWAIGTRVVDHALIGRGNRFSEGERVAFWTRVLAAEPGDVIHHYWFHEGRAVMKADLRIGGPHWRTYSRYTLPEGSSGSWVVEARDRSGRVLAREEFLCVEDGG